MKISESTWTGLSDSVAGYRRKSAEGTDTAPADSQSLSLPSMLALTEAGHPARETFLAALSQSLKDGLYTCEPEQVAEAILTRGLGTPPHIEA